MANEAVATQKVEKTVEVKNCVSCNKPLRKVKRYYRNGKYYCNKKCWKTGTQPAQGSQQEPQQEPQKESKKE